MPNYDHDRGMDINAYTAGRDVEPSPVTLTSNCYLRQIPCSKEIYLCFIHSNFLDNPLSNPKRCNIKKILSVVHAKQEAVLRALMAPVLVEMHLPYQAKFTVERTTGVNSPLSLARIKASIVCA
jgi:hypothetical protein